MKNESMHVVESLFNNPLGFFKLESPQVYNNMIVIPIIVQQDKLIDFITIKEAEELELIQIIETDTVNQLEVVNKSDKQILIPFGMTVHGGKQDRTIWEPILLPIGGKQSINPQKAGTPVNKYTIPAKCVEQSRWSYKNARDFKSSNTRLHPNVAYEAISVVGQSGVWQEIQSYRAEMKYSNVIAPTQSYLEMTQESEKETKNMVSNFKNIDNQCGIAVFINGEFIGMEFYANPKAWESMSKDILKAFSIEALRFKDKPQQKEDGNYHEEFIALLNRLILEFSTRKGVGIGNVVEFTSKDNKWRGITLTRDKTMAQFYMVSKRGGYQNQPQPNLQFQTIVDQRYI